MVIYPEYKKFEALAKKFSLVPAFLEVPGDTETPVTAFLKLSGKNPYAALLESVEGGEKFGRYSFISVSHHLKFEFVNGQITFTPLNHSPVSTLLSTTKQKIRTQNPLHELKKIFLKLKPAVLPELPRFCGGAIGMLSYDIVRTFEKLPNLLKEDLKIPEALLLFTDECVVFDHWKHKLILIKWNPIFSKSRAGIKRIYQTASRSLVALKNRIEKSTVSLPQRHGSKNGKAGCVEKSNCSPAGFKDKVRRVKEYIRAGDVIQTVISQRFEVQASLDPFQIYRALRMVNPSPYLYYLRMNDFTLAGSSPEILVRKEGKRAITRPIAGTRPRGASEKEDLQLEKELLHDPKEKAEHLMLVDLGRNDLGRVCKSGSVKVSDFMKIERYSHVMHLVSNVEGILRENEDAFSLLQACFPAGTVTGAPKIRAMEIIEELEKVKRGIYAGAVGYFSYSGNMDMAITIRTILCKGNKFYIQAGAGIVADSVPEREEKETRSKARGMLRAIELAGKGDSSFFQ